MLVSAMPNTSRNSVTGSMMGSPGFAIRSDPATASSHAAGTAMLASACLSENADNRTGAPAPACSSRAWFCLLVAHAT